MARRSTTPETSGERPGAARPRPDPGADRFAALQAAVSAFNRERDWRQFHAPKNLAMALAIEAAELMEPFRWDTPEQSWERARSPEALGAVSEEMADVLLLLLSMADYLEVDLLEETRRKLERNRERYPADRARGRADKYTAYAAAEEPPAPPRARKRAPGRRA